MREQRRVRKQGPRSARLRQSSEQHVADRYRHGKREQRAGEDHGQRFAFAPAKQPEHGSESRRDQREHQRRKQFGTRRGAIGASCMDTASSIDAMQNAANSPMSANDATGVERREILIKALPSFLPPCAPKRRAGLGWTYCGRSQCQGNDKCSPLSPAKFGTQCR